MCPGGKDRLRVGLFSLDLRISKCEQAARQSHQDSPSQDSLDQMVFQDSFQPGPFSHIKINQFSKNML